MAAEPKAVQAQSPMSDRITVRNVHESFLRMEETEDLHGSRTANGTYYWDVVRRSVFISLYGVYGGGFTVPSAPTAGRLISTAKNLVKSLINEGTRRYLAARAPEYVFITAQRIRRGSQLFDPVADHLYESVCERAAAVELLNKAAFSYLDMVRGKKTRLPPVSVRITLGAADLPQIVERISSVVCKHFGVSIDVYGPVWEAMTTFEANRAYYRRLFEKHRPKAIVGVDNGSLKGMFSAAKDSQVPTIELQHGEINQRNIGYSYPKSVSSSHDGLALPTVFLTFSDYWNGVTHYPVKRVCSVGNDYFYQEKIAGDDGILIISAYPYHEALIALSLEAADLVGGRTMYYKLHPHQFGQKDAIVAACSSKRNIVVVSDEMELPELLKRCDFVVGVHSTMTYIALQAGKKVCLYKRSSYFRHDDIFAYVELFDSASELQSIINSPPGKYFHDQGSLPVFFEPFTARRFTETLERVENCGHVAR